MDWQSSMRTSLEKGIESGKLKKAQEVALALKQEGMASEKIAKIVGMGAEDVKKWIDEE